MNNRVDTSRYLVGQLVSMLGPALTMGVRNEAQQMARRRLEALMGEAADAFLKAGNCHEQATCAYRFLSRRPRANDVHICTVSMAPYSDHDRHVFVTLGQPRAGATLGDLGDVVVCDPWVAEVLNRSVLGRIGAYYPDDYHEYVEAAQAGQYQNEVEVLVRPL